MIIELTESTETRTTKLLDYWQGHKAEFQRLISIICLSNSMENVADSIDLRKLYDLDRISTRLDNLTTKHI